MLRDGSGARFRSPDAFPWRVVMSWHDLLFAHWPVEPEQVASRLPRCRPDLELDLWEGRAWIGIVPFRMSGIRFRGLPPFPGTHAFPELNVRTYVRANGRPGVWFFSLDAASWLAVRVARLTYHLPYFDADLACQTRPDGGILYRSRRTHRGGGVAELDVAYHPAGPVFAASPGSFEHWLTERYRLFAANRAGQLFRGEIQHVPWPLQPAAAEWSQLRMTEAAGLPLPRERPHLLFSRDLSVKAAGLVPA